MSTQYSSITLSICQPNTAALRYLYVNPTQQHYVIYMSTNYNSIMLSICQPTTIALCYLYDNPPQQHYVYYLYVNPLKQHYVTYNFNPQQQHYVDGLTVCNHLPGPYLLSTATENIYWSLELDCIGNLPWDKMDRFSPDEFNYIRCLALTPRLLMSTVVFCCFLYVLK